MAAQPQLHNGHPSPRHPRVLVTGGAGFIGANVVRMLLDGGYQVTVLDNLNAAAGGNLEGLSVELIQGDILDADIAARAVRGHDAVIHLAAQTGVPASLEDPRADLETNVIGTLNMLEAVREAAPEARFIYASSNAPLGGREPPVSEDKAPLPISPYGASKLAGEAYCQAYHGSWGLGTVALRFANVYGPFSSHKGSVVAKFLTDAMTTGSITIDGDGGQTRDFLYVGDLCRAVHLAIESDAAGEVIQIANGTETSILTLAELIRAALGGDVQVKHGPGRQGDPRRNYSSIAKAKALLGWEPRESLASGLEKTVHWFRERAMASA